MSNIKYVDLDGLSHFKSKADSTYVAQETGKVLSSNDYTNAEKTKLAGIDEGAEVNVIESVVVNGQTATIAGKTASVTIETGAIDSISVNGTAQSIDANKNVDITVPTKTSDLTNDDNVVKDASYVHTDNNFTNALKTKVENSDANVIETIKVNGTEQTVTSKAVDITVPTNNNQLTNGAGYQTSSQVESAITSKGYQTASDVSSAISSAIAGVTQFDYSIVASLPASGVKGTIYLISNSGSGTNNYDEYIWVNNAWEKLGTLAVDLSGYVQTTDLVAITNAEIDALFV